MAIKYIVQPEEKQVIAILEDTRYDFINKAIKICNRLSDNKSHVIVIPNLDLETIHMPNRFKIVVKCKEGDTFDSEIGKKIAKERLMTKYYKSFDKRLFKFMRELSSILNDTEYYKIFNEYSDEFHSDNDTDIE